MPRKNFYLADADVPIYEKAKEYVGDSLSSFIVDALKKLVQEREDRGKDLVEIRLWTGREDHEWDLHSGEYIKFTGRLLATGDNEIAEYSYNYQLYETRKGGFLLYTKSYSERERATESSYRTFKDYIEVTKLQLPSRLFQEAEAKLKDFKCVELDI